jgi:predicted nuclease with TOPRIM domain
MAGIIPTMRRRKLLEDIRIDMAQGHVEMREMRDEMRGMRGEMREVRDEIREMRDDFHRLVEEIGADRRFGNELLRRHELVTNAVLDELGELRAESRTHTQAILTLLDRFQGGGTAPAT